MPGLSGASRRRIGNSALCSTTPTVIDANVMRALRKGQLPASELLLSSGT